jgi:hypothetical protein
MTLLNGGFSRDNFNIFLNGGESTTNCSVIQPCLYYDGLYARSNNFLPPFDGLDSRPNNQPSLNGGFSIEVCPPPPETCIMYDGKFAINEITYNIEGGTSSDNYPFYLNAGTSQISCVICCLPCVTYTGLTSADNYLPSFNGETSLPNNYTSLTAGTSSLECLCFCRC